MLGTAWAFVIAIGIIVLWTATGHVFNYSDTWQLIINTGTTIVTFLMVFLIQNTQNRDSKAVHWKLDDLSARSAAHGIIWSTSNTIRPGLRKLQDEFAKIGKKADATEARIEQVQDEIAAR